MQLPQVTIFYDGVCSQKIIFISSCEGKKINKKKHNFGMKILALTQSEFGKSIDVSVCFHKRLINHEMIISRTNQTEKTDI